MQSYLDKVLIKLFREEDSAVKAYSHDGEKVLQQYSSFFIIIHYIKISIISWCIKKCCGNNSLWLVDTETMDTKEKQHQHMSHRMNRNFCAVFLHKSFYEREIQFKMLWRLIFLNRKLFMNKHDIFVFLNRTL